VRLKKDFQISFVFTWVRVRRYIKKNVLFDLKGERGDFIRKIILLLMNGLLIAYLAGSTPGDPCILPCLLLQ
jgi:hypothetical protein